MKIYCIEAKGLVDKVNKDVVRVDGCGSKREGVGGSELGSQVVEGERSKVVAVEEVGDEVKDGFTGGK